MKKLIRKWLGIEELHTILENQRIEIYRLNFPFEFNLGDEVNLARWPIKEQESGFIVDRKWENVSGWGDYKSYLISINNKTAYWVEEERLTLKSTAK